MKNLTMLTLLLLVCINCFRDGLYSSELKETQAENHKLDVWIDEPDGSATANVNALVSTIPDDVEIQFNQGETLQVSSKDDNESFQDVIFMSLEELGPDPEPGDWEDPFATRYLASLTKPSAEDLYRITYTDKDGLITNVEFASEGAPTLLTPANNEVVSLDSTLLLTWEPRNPGDLIISVRFMTDDIYPEYAYFTTTDNGSYALDLTLEDFDTAVPGKATIRLFRTSTYTNFAGWGESSVTVHSEAQQTVQLE